MKTSPKREIDGVLLIDKPFGKSSNGVLQKVRWLYHAKKAGHTGNLDPYATGLLPVCFGEATKFSQYGLEADKGYLATITLGATSNTGDGEGNIQPSHQRLPTSEKLREALQHFRGEITQIPPMYSALKYQGRALYEYARRGETVERVARKVFIKSLSLVQQVDECTIIVDVVCSKGTYIRTLAEDIGAYLECGAYLSGLQRTSTAGFTLHKAYTLDQIEAKTPQERYQLLLPVDVFLEELPRKEISVEDARGLLQGKKIAWPEKSKANCPYRLYVADKPGDNNRFIGIGMFNEENYLYPHRMLAKAVEKYLLGVTPAKAGI